ncbi:MAG: 2Fe-2S iron-sulfur cluster binding domain-containing protein, partial [Frankia sp.]|nr:2Fe-2S iron-sulfur cluster binding domain-containing protein [Frankia sp.]
MTSARVGGHAPDAGTVPVTLIAADGERFDLDCAPEQSVLDAAASSGVVLPASCRSGTCGSCHATVTHGAYDLGEHSATALLAAERERGEVLLCRTVPRGPLAVTLPYAGSRILRGGLPVRQGTIVALETVARDTVRLELRLQPDDEGDPGSQFDPGQFVELQIPGQDDRRAYSLANTGNWEGRLEFFIRLRPGGYFSGYLAERARIGDPLLVHGPQGAFGLRETGLGPRWFVAGGTGLAPLLAMVRHMAEWQEPQPARLLLGVNEEADVYGQTELAAVAAELPGFTYEICVWRAGPGWRGATGTPADCLGADLRRAQA